MPNSVTCIDQTPPIFEWWGLGGSKNGHKKDVCSEGIELHAHHLFTLLGLVVNIIEGGGGVYMIIY